MRTWLVASAVAGMLLTGGPGADGARTGRKVLDAVPGGCLPCAARDVAEGELLGWALRSDPGGEKARAYLAEVLAWLRRDPAEYDLEGAVEEWRRERARLVVRGTGPGAPDVRLTAIERSGEGGDAAVCVTAWTWIEGDGPGQRDLRVDQGALLRATWVVRRHDFAELADWYGGEECPWLPAVCKAWSAAFRKMSARFDARDYSWAVSETGDGCCVSIIPRTSGLPDRSYWDGDTFVMPFGDEWEFECVEFPRDPETGTCVPGTPEGIGSGDGDDRAEDGVPCIRWAGPGEWPTVPVRGSVDFFREILENLHRPVTRYRIETRTPPRSADDRLSVLAVPLGDGLPMLRIFAWKAAGTADGCVVVRVLWEDESVVTPEAETIARFLWGLRHGVVERYAAACADGPEETGDPKIDAWYRQRCAFWRRAAARFDPADWSLSVQEEPGWCTVVIDASERLPTGVAGENGDVVLTIETKMAGHAFRLVRDPETGRCAPVLLPDD